MGTLMHFWLAYAIDLSPRLFMASCPVTILTRPKAIDHTESTLSHSASGLTIIATLKTRSQLFLFVSSWLEVSVCTRAED